jgi:hypothetical protein
MGSAPQCDLGHHVPDTAHPERPVTPPPRPADHAGDRSETTADRESGPTTDRPSEPDRAATTDHVHLRIPLSHPEVPSECVWAVPLGDERYRVANVPFLVHHVGLGDVVVAAEVTPGELELVEVVERVHVASFSYELHRHVDAVEFVERASAVGIATEGMAGRLFASSASDHASADRLERMLEDDAEWFERFTPDGAVLRSHGDVLGR